MQSLHEITQRYTRFLKGKRLSSSKKITERMMQSLSAHLCLSETNGIPDFSGIVLRRYAGEKTLVVGCGNEPCYVGGYPTHTEQQHTLSEYDREALSQESLDYFREYRKDHKHKKCYTVNPDIGMNPSVIAQFGVSSLIDILPESSFTEIVFEGFRLESEDSVCTVTDLIHLLAENGVVSIHNNVCEDCEKKYTVLIKKDGVLVSIKDDFIIGNESDYHLFEGL